MTEDFYQSREWLSLRYEALKRYGAICQCCGQTRSKDNPIQVDHIKSRYLHPDLALDITNLQILCKRCNMGKGYKDDTDWRDYEKSVEKEKRLDLAIRRAKPTAELMKELKKLGDPKIFAELEELMTISAQVRLMRLKDELWKRRRLAVLKNELASRRSIKSVHKDLFQ
jgi:HNH endonuclease